MSILRWLGRESVQNVARKRKLGGSHSTPYLTNFVIHTSSYKENAMHDVHIYCHNSSPSLYLSKPCCTIAEEKSLLSYLTD